VNADVCWHGLVEFQEKVDCPPEADVTEVESLLELVEGEVNVGHEKHDFHGHKEDGFHDFRALKLRRVGATELFSNQLIHREHLIPLDLNGLDILISDGFRQNLINDIKDQLINLPSNKVLIQPRGQIINVIVHHHARRVWRLLDQRSDRVEWSLHDVFRELDIGGWDVVGGDLLDLGLHGFVVQDSVAVVVGLLDGAVGEPAEVAADFLVRDVDALAGEGGELARGHVRDSVLEEDPLVQVVVVEFLLVVGVHPLVVALNQLRAHEVLLPLRDLNHLLILQIRKIVLKPLSDVLVEIQVLDQEELENLLVDSHLDLLARGAFHQVVVALGEQTGLVVVPGVDQDEAQYVGEHACVVDQFERAVEELVLGLDV